MPVSSGRLPGGVRAAFGIGQIAEGIQSAVFIFFLLFYYNQVLGVSGALCGLALAISLLFDAVTDPLVGNLSDAWHGRGGRRHPFMYVAALPLGLCFFGLFNPPVSGEWALFAWLLTMTILCRGAMTLYHVPHSALGAELSSDYTERTLLVATRHFFGAIAYIGVFVLGFLIYFVPTEEYPNGQLNPQAYGPFTGWLALAMTLSVWYSAFGTRRRIPHLPQARPEQRFEIMGLVRQTWLASQNTSFRALIIGFAIIIIAFGAAGALNMYMLTFFWQLQPSGVMLVLIAGPIASMIGYATARRFFSRFEQRQGVMVGIGVWLLAHGSSVPLFQAGLLPEPGTTGILIAAIVFGMIGAFGIAQLLVGMGTMLADITDEYELESGLRQEGIFFGAFSFTNKCSAALGSLIGGSILDLLQWPAGEGVRSAADIPPAVLDNLGWVWGPLTAVLAVPGLLWVARYRLNRERHQAILDALEGRREAATGTD